MRGVQYFIRILLLPKVDLFYFQCGKKESFHFFRYNEYFYSQQKTDISKNLNHALNITNRPIFFVTLEKIYDTKFSGFQRFNMVNNSRI